jgi:hypothetical protein
MINFNVKYVTHGVSSDPWYNEMLSKMAEDIISPLIGVGASNWKNRTGSISITLNKPNNNDIDIYILVR